MKTALMDPRTETWEEVRRHVYHTCRRFARQFNRRDLQEVLSEGRYHYQQAYVTFDYRKGFQFTTWVGFKVWKGLLSTYRTECRRDRIISRAPMPEDVCCREPSGFDLADFMLDLTEDATTVVSLVLASHPDLFVRKGDGGYYEARDRKQVVREMLEEMGWDRKRINRAFKIIRRAL